MIGKWNRSVIATYVGMLFAVAAMILTMANLYGYAMMCFMAAGICDLFDGTIARMCKRTEEEKNFGIQLDSLVDVVSFIALPIVFVVKFSGISWYAIAASVMYSVFGVARLAYFNVCQEENEDKDSPIKYYTGMPVTYAALIFPIIYLLHVFLTNEVVSLLMCIVMEIMAILFILKLKFIKPGKKGYIFLMLLAIALFVLYIVFGR
ncbi:MAG: CDP-alcohol phosphatidyltransferase family protein [Clostridiales bacterium]|nr:CDP-alcohol phosphatidyltransferase family protein [Clostridiales bacterium]